LTFYLCRDNFAVIVSQPFDGFAGANLHNVLFQSKMLWVPLFQEAENREAGENPARSRHSKAILDFGF